MSDASDPRAYAIKTAYAAYKRQVRWLNAVDAHIETRKTNPAAEPPALRLMPSKAAKHQMYGQVGAAIIIAHGIDSDAYQNRPHNLAGLHTFFSQAVTDGILSIRGDVPIWTDRHGMAARKA